MPQHTLIAAEIGTAHQGSLEKGYELIQAAADTGADFAKFQIVFAYEILPKNAGLVPLPGGDTPLYEVFQKMEREADFYRALKEKTETLGLKFLASPFGIHSARLLRDLSPSYIKIASPELNHIPLLKEVASYNIPIILSSGVSLLEDIDESLEVISKVQNENIKNNTIQNILLHCITSYPAPEEEFNLRLLPEYQRRYQNRFNDNISVGISDHSTHPTLVPQLAVSQGAIFIEKHITLSKTTDGLDDPIALDVDDFIKMVRSIRQTEKMGSEEILAQAKHEFGEDRVNAVLGSGKKVLAPAEAANYGRTNRSIHASKELKAGDILSKENIAVLRTEKILRVGLHPRHYDEVLGKKLQRDVPSGEGILREDLDPQ